jgi:hypothetical protein
VLARGDDLKAGAEPRRWKLVFLSAITITGLIAGAYFYAHRAPKLTEKDTVVLADFSNSTGDGVFDGTLRQGLTVELEQSPFLPIFGVV